MLDKGLRGICQWGSQLGKEVSVNKLYRQIFFFDGDSNIIDFVMKHDWLNSVPHTATPSLYAWKVYNEVQKHFVLYPIGCENNKILDW